MHKSKNVSQVLLKYFAPRDKFFFKNGTYKLLLQSRKVR